MKQIDPALVAQQLTEFLQKSSYEAGFRKAVVALSGGVDSATSCALTVRALGKTNVYPVLLPYGKLNQPGVTDALRATDSLGIPRRSLTKIDIAPLVDPILALDPTMDNIRKGNIAARVRMIVLFDQAKKRTALVVGTENKTEHLLGYFTRFGDEASDIEPLRNLYKTQVYQLAKHLDIPESILLKPPTAGLWMGQTDEGEFGFTYREADEILPLLYDEKKSVEEIVAAGWQREVVEKVWQRASQNAFKHHLPITP